MVSRPSQARPRPLDRCALPEQRHRERRRRRVPPGLLPFGLRVDRRLHTRREPVRRRQRFTAVGTDRLQSRAGRDRSRGATSDGGAVRQGRGNRRRRRGAEPLRARR